MAMPISRRGLVLGAALALPVLGVVRASDPNTSFTPDRRQRRVLETRREAAQAEFNSSPPAHATNLDEERLKVLISRTSHAPARTRSRMRSSMIAQASRQPNSRTP